MFTPVSVSLSGPAFSLLLYENSKCRFQQEGFLLGEVVHKETKTITDNDQQQVNISKTIKINSIMPCPQTHYFYNGLGKVNKEKIIEFLGSHFRKVVAWYKYQSVASPKFTIRDKIIHRQLMDFFSIPPELFTCCLLSNEVSDNAATHLYTQTFVRCNNIGYEKLPIHIPNLSEPNNTYKSSEPASETFNKIMGDLKIDKKNTQGLVVINKIQNALQKHIDSVVKSLSVSEQYLFELEEEVKQLQILKKLEKKNEENNLSEQSCTVIDLDSPVTKRHPIDSTPDSSPEVLRKTFNKPSSNVRGRGRKRGSSGSKDGRRHSKSDDKEVVGC